MKLKYHQLQKSNCENFHRKTKLVLKRIQELKGEPRPNHSRKLRGQNNIYRVRVGNYRILYSIEDKHLIIIILKVGHRGDVYR